MMHTVQHCVHMVHTDLKHVIGSGLVVGLIAHRPLLSDWVQQLTMWGFLAFALLSIQSSSSDVFT